MKPKSYKQLALLAALALGINLSATAQVNMTFTWTGSLWESGYSGQYIQSDDAIGIYAFNVATTSKGGPPASPPNFYSVCLSPAGLLDESSHTYNVVQFSTANPGIYPSSWAYGTVNNQVQYWGIQNAGYLWNTFGTYSTVNAAPTTAQQGAALEFAIWTALYDSTAYGTLSGNSYAAPTGLMDATTLAYYNLYISALHGQSIPLFTGNVLEGQGEAAGANSGQSQEFLFLTSPVPEPSTVLAGVSLLALVLGTGAKRILGRNRLVEASIHAASPLGRSE